MISPWLTQHEAAKRARVSIRTFRTGVKAGRYPQGKLVSRRRRVWHVAELDAAIAGTDPRNDADPIMAAIHAAFAS